MALLFDSGNQQRVSRADNFGLTDWPCTLAAWILPTTIGVDQIVFTLGSGAASRYALIGVNSSDQLFAAKNNTPDSATATTSSTVGTAAWAHICGKFSSNTSMDIFQDGANKQSSATSCTFNSDPTHAVIGAHAAGVGGSYFSGHMAEIAIWNVALDDAEVASLAKGFCPLLIRPQSIVAYFPFMRGDTNGATHFDRYKNGYNVAESGTGSPAQSAHPRVIYPVGLI